MRILSASLFFLILLNFSGVPELLAGVIDQEQSFLAIEDDTDNKEKEDSKEKEEKGKEDLKETILAEDIFFTSLRSGPSLETMNGILRDSGYYPEDHFPPPELS